MLELLASFAADPVSLRVRRQARTAPRIPVGCGDRLRLRQNQADEHFPAGRIKRLASHPRLRIGPGFCWQT